MGSEGLCGEATGEGRECGAEGNGRREGGRGDGEGERKKRWGRRGRWGKKCEGEGGREGEKGINHKIKILFKDLQLYEYEQASYSYSFQDFSCKGLQLGCNPLQLKFLTVSSHHSLQAAHDAWIPSRKRRRVSPAAVPALADDDALAAGSAGELLPGAHRAPTKATVTCRLKAGSIA